MLTAYNALNMHSTPGVLYFCVLLILSLDTRNTFGQTGAKAGTGKARGVNLFIINDEDDKMANHSVTSALKSLREKNPDMLGRIHIVRVNGSNPKESLDRICSAWDSAIKTGGDRVPDLLLDTTKSGEGASISNSFAAAVGVPSLSGQYGQEGDLRYWRNLDADRKNYLIQVMPPADLLPEIVRQLAMQLNISNAAILFDDNFVMDHKYKSLLLNVPTRHIINEAAQTVNEMRTQLSRLRDLDVVNFFILGDENTVNIALDSAESLNFTGRKYGWFMVTLNDDFWPSCECRNVSFLFVRPKSVASGSEGNSGNDKSVSTGGSGGNESSNSSGSGDVERASREESTTRTILARPLIASAFYYDLTRLGVEAMRLAIQNGDWPTEPSHIGCDQYNGNNTPVRNFDLLANLKKAYAEGANGNGFVPMFAGFNFSEKNGEHRADFEAGVYLGTIENAALSKTVESGSWKAGINSPLQVTNDVILNTTAVTSYRVVTVIQPPFVMYDKEKDEWSGFCIDLLNEIRETVDFEYDIREVADKEYGSLFENGSWNGLIRELIEKRADIAIGTLWVMAEREKVVDFTVPFYDLVGLTILMVKSKAPTSLFKFLTVLENEVWLCILAAYFFTSFLMWVFDRWSPYSYQNNRERYKNDDEKREFNLKECLWFCMTSLTPQGGGEAPKNLSGRLVAATWWLFGFIIIASYTANLAAFLTVSRLDTPVDSLEDLSKQYKIQYAPALNSPAYIYFQRMSDIEVRFYEIWKDMSLNDSLSDVERAKLAVWDYPVSDKYTKMFQAMKEAKFPANTEEALRRVRRLDSKNEFAYIADASTIKYLVLTNCDLVQVGDEFSRKPYAIAVQQGSPLKDQFNNAILILLNKRKLEKMKDKWWRRNPMRQTCDKEDDQSDGISIHNIGGVFIVIFVGIVLACFTLAFEYWWYRYRPRINDRLSSSPRLSRNDQSKVTKPSSKPIRFQLQPAPTHRFHAAPPPAPPRPLHSVFRSRF